MMPHFHSWQRSSVVKHHTSYLSKRRIELKMTISAQCNLQKLAFATTLAVTHRSFARSGNWAG